MKYARTALAAFAAAWVGLVLIATRPASGQALAPRPAPSPNPFDNPVAPVVTYYAPMYHYAGQGTPDPELNKLLGEEANLDRETARLVGEYSRTEDEVQRSKTKVLLAETLQKQFDLQQKRRDLEVAAIETQLKKLREIMRKRAEARQTIIDKRLDQLLREADGLGWTPPHGGSAGRNLYPGASYSTNPSQPQQR